MRLAAPLLLLALPAALGATTDARLALGSRRVRLDAVASVAQARHENAAALAPQRYVNGIDFCGVLLVWTQQHARMPVG